MINLTHLLIVAKKDFLFGIFERSLQKFFILSTIVSFDWERCLVSRDEEKKLPPYFLNFRSREKIRKYQRKRINAFPLEGVCSSYSFHIRNFDISFYLPVCSLIWFALLLSFICNGVIFAVQFKRLITERVTFWTSRTNGE